MEKELVNRDPSSRRILVVEDNQTVSDLIVEILASLRYENVSCAADGLEAWSLFEEGQLFDLVICDWVMPKMSGFEVLKQLRASHSEIPFIMISGQAAQSEIEEARAHGVTAFIPKPFGIPEIIAAIDMSLAQYDARLNPSESDVWEI